MINKEISKDVVALSRYLIENKYTISFAESMTGGLLVSELVKVEGISKVLKESYITYSSHSKIKILKVKNETISNYHVVSIEVCKELLTGLINLSKSDIGVVITGYAQLVENSSRSYNNELNLPYAFIGFYVLGETFYHELNFSSNNRLSNLETAVKFIYQKLVEIAIK